MLKPSSWTRAWGIHDYLWKNKMGMWVVSSEGHILGNVCFTAASHVSPVGINDSRVDVISSEVRCGERGG